MRMQTVLILLAVAAVAYFVFTSREGLKWDRGFAGFLAATPSEINLGSMEVPGDRIDKLAVSDKVIKGLVDSVGAKLAVSQNLTVFPIETVFIEVYGSEESISKMKKERPDVYEAYIKYLDSVQQDNASEKGNGKQKRAALVSYLDTLKNFEVARVPAGVPLTYRARLLLLETKRFYGIETDVVAVGDEKTMKVLGITTKTVDSSSNIQPFLDELKAGQWQPYSTIANAGFKHKGVLEMANEAIEAKLKR